MEKAYREDRLMCHPFCGETPPPPPILNDIGAEVMKFLKSQGLGPIYRPTPQTARKVQTVIDRLWKLFPYELTGKNHPPVHGVYLYDEEKCSGEFSGADGMCSTNTTTGIDGFSVIGIDRSTVEAGEKYLTLVLIHEFAHAIAPGPGDDNWHSPFYEAKLEELILNYNAAHGTNIKHDRVTFNDEQRKMNRVEIEAKAMGVSLWQIAEELAIPEDEFVAMMNRTLSREAEAKMLQVIQKLRPTNMGLKNCNTTR